MGKRSVAVVGPARAGSGRRPRILSSVGLRAPGSQVEELGPPNGQGQSKRKHDGAIAATARPDPLVVAAIPPGFDLGGPEQSRNVGRPHH
eukprot:1711273-Alexandrium_andersonii.AAC.1